SGDRLPEGADPVHPGGSAAGRVRDGAVPIEYSSGNGGPRTGQRGRPKTQEALMPQPTSPDHPRRLRLWLREFFEASSQAFSPVWAARFESTAIDWLDKELFLAPPQGEKRQLDLVARLRLRPGAPPPWPGMTDLVALVHIELESR